MHEILILIRFFCSP